MNSRSTTSDSSSSTTAAMSCEKDLSPTLIKARQFVERVIRLQIETSYRGDNETTTQQQKKEAFLHFVRILQRLLQQKDPKTHVKVKVALQECALRKAQADQADGYETVTASMATTLICLQQIVRPIHWKRAVDYMKQHHNSTSWSMMIESIAMDDMIFFTQRLMEKQNEFRAATFKNSTVVAKQDTENDKVHEYKDDHFHHHHHHHPLYVDIGVHYTKYSNLDRIQVNGLLSRNERGQIGILAERFNGDVHGNGIYTGNNPYAYTDFGDVGILVARLKGKTLFRSGKGSDNANLKPTSSSSSCSAETGEPDKDNINYNSIVVGNGYSQMVVLGESSQCIPLLHFPRSMVDKHKAAAALSSNNTSNEFSSSSSAAAAAAGSYCAILYYQEELQKIVDEFFNQGISIPCRHPPRQQQQPPPVTSNSNSGNSTLQQQKRRMDTIKNVVYQIVYTIVFMAIVGTIVSMSVSLCLFMVKTMSSLSSSRLIEL